MGPIEEQGVNLWQKIIEKRAAAGLGEASKTQEQQKQYRCPNCMAVLKSPVNVCPHCGKNTSKAKIVPLEQEAAIAEAETAKELDLPEAARGLAKIKGATQRAREIRGRRRLKALDITIIVAIVIILTGIGFAVALQTGILPSQLNPFKAAEPPKQAPASPVVSNTAVSSVDTKGATINWSTSPPSYAKVLYGKSESYGMSVQTDNETTAHQVSLADLEPGTTYHFLVLATDIDGKELARGQDNVFTTATERDTRLPVVSQLKVTPSDIGAIIQWDTDKPSTSQVLYGTTESCNSFTSIDPRFVTRHTVKLSGLEANTKYYYRVKSADIDGNEAVMDPPNVFTTLVSVPTGSRIGDRAPDFTLPVFKSQDNVSLRSFKGQKVLLTFWAVYCPECDRELALLQSLKNRNLPGVTILAVFLESRLDDIDKTIAKYKADRGDLSVPVLVDMYRTTAHMYNVDRVPCTIFIDGDGIIREIEYGSFNIDRVEQTLDNL